MLKFSCEKALLQAAADTLLSPDLQADIREQIQFHFVQSAREVLDIALLPEKKPKRSSAK